ncbi:MAG: thermonuclease family protein [Candidatus Bathyarchaeota archaeon]|jgi:endonuclease YncB( thermonuclease family)|nr:thermonuclease family protein [Candidatus Bathyarchaeota archaeon]
MNKKTFAIFVFFIFTLLMSGLNSVCAINIDRIAVVELVWDGDTLKLDSGDWVRFADVDAPEDDEAGYAEAKSYVANLVEGKTVYLDIDSKTVTDSYGRLVCVVYYDYSSTEYGNLNKALLVNGFAVVDDYDTNVFDPATWTLTVAKPNSSTSTPTPNISTPSPTATQSPTVEPTATPAPVTSDSNWLLIAFVVVVLVVVVVAVVLVKRQKKTGTTDLPPPP